MMYPKSNSNIVRLIIYNYTVVVCENIINNKLILNIIAHE